MAAVKMLRRSLRFRIVALTGGVVVTLMLIISLGILLQWRALILKELHNKAESITRAFSISVLDALIYSENQKFRVEDLLESYIADLKRSVPGIRTIIITDVQGRVIAHSDPAMYNRVLNDSLSRQLSKVNRLVSGIYRLPGYGWVIEAAMPLRIWSKRWGLLRIAFDANETRDEIRRLFFLLFGLTVLVAAVVLWVLSYLIGRMFQSLGSLVQAMDSIDLEKELAIDLPQRDDEIGFLIRRFEMLRQRLYQSHQQLLLAQKQVYHAEKLASIGRLASGVAHEINNPLNGIKNCLYAIRQNPDDGELRRKYLELIDEGLTQIETVVQKLLGFARTAPRAVTHVDVNRVIRQVVELLEYRLKQKHIEVQLQLARHLPPVRGDYSLLQEVIMNLLLNSFDAVEDGGRVRVHTKQKDTHFVLVSVEDNGEGISADDLPKIFDPFYTTKDPGEGTGLGLSVALEIVEAHGGKIEVQSQPGVGTEFTITLPIGEDE